MPHYRRTITAGNVIEIEEYFALRKKEQMPSAPHSERILPTSLSQVKINRRNARKALARKLNANFKKGDLFVTLTFESEISVEGAQKAFKRFLRVTRNNLKVHGLTPLKYVAVLEASLTKRCHYHVVMNNIVDLNAMAIFWRFGAINVQTLYSDDLTPLARYMSKQPPCSAFLYTCSKKLVKPTVVVELVVKPIDKDFIILNFKQIDYRMSACNFGIYISVKYIKLRNRDIYYSDCSA